MIDPLTIVSAGVALGTIIVSIGAAVRIARGSMQRETRGDNNLLTEQPPDMRAALMHRLNNEIRRPYAPPPRVKK